MDCSNGRVHDDSRPTEEINRRTAKLDLIRQCGMDPFGGPYELTSNAETIRTNCDDMAGQEVSIAGRIMAFRRDRKSVV